MILLTLPNQERHFVHCLIDSLKKPVLKLQYKYLCELKISLKSIIDLPALFGPVNRVKCEKVGMGGVVNVHALVEAHL